MQRSSLIENKKYDLLLQSNLKDPKVYRDLIRAHKGKPPLQKDMHRHVSNQINKRPVPFAIQKDESNNAFLAKPKNNDVDQFQNDI